MVYLSNPSLSNIDSFNIFHLIVIIKYHIFFILALVTDPKIFIHVFLTDRPHIPFNTKNPTYSAFHLRNNRIQLKFAVFYFSFSTCIKFILLFVDNFNYCAFA